MKKTLQFVQFKREIRIRWSQAKGQRCSLVVRPFFWAKASPQLADLELPRVLLLRFGDGSLRLGEM